MEQKAAEPTVDVRLTVRTAAMLFTFLSFCYRNFQVALSVEAQHKFRQILTELSTQIEPHHVSFLETCKATFPTIDFREAPPELSKDDAEDAMLRAAAATKKGKEFLN